MKSIDYTVKQELSQEAKNMLEKFNNQEKLINYKKLNFKGGSNVDYDFSNFISLRELFRVIYYGEIIIPAVEREQGEFDYSLRALKEYNPRKVSKYKKLKDDLVINAQNFYDGREMVINAFEDKICPLNNPNGYAEYNSQESGNFIGLDELFAKAEKKLDSNIIEKYFYSDSLKKLYNYLNFSKDNSSHVFIKTILNSLKYDLKKNA